MDTVDVGEVSDFTEGAIRTVVVGHHEVGIVRWRDNFYAVRNFCSHQGGPLCRGRLGPKLVSDGFGRLVVDRDTPIVACPWHGWEFEAATGRSVWSDRYRVKTWPIRIDNGRVLVDI